MPSFIHSFHYLRRHGVCELNPLSVSLGKWLGLVIEGHLLIIEPHLIPGQGDGAQHRQHTLRLALGETLGGQVICVYPELVCGLLNRVIERLRQNGKTVKFHLFYLT